MASDTSQSLTVRDAVVDDVAALTALARKTFTDKFSHLYNPGDLAAFLEESAGAGASARRPGAQAGLCR